MAASCCFLLLPYWVAMAHGRDAVPGNPSGFGNGEYITWVTQFPPYDGKSEKKSFSRRFTDFVFGKKNAVELSKPVAITAKDTNHFMVLDQANGVIFRVSGKVGEITRFKNKKYPGFTSLVGICSIPGKKVLFTDSYLNKVFVANPDNKELESLADSVHFDRPTGIAYSDVTREIWVVESNAHRVSVISEDGRLIRQVGSRGTAPGEFNYPTSLWIDKTGQVYIVDALNFRVQVFSKDGTLITVFGEIGDATGYFARPKGIATDSHGNIYVADALFHTVQIFDPSGHFLYRFGSQGHERGEFWMPAGLFIDQDDNIYVADSYNSRVQVFHLNYKSNE